MFRMATVLSVLCGLLVSNSAMAEGDDYTRRGAYIGIGFGGAWDPLEDLIEEQFPEVVDLKPTWSFNARAGYRVFSWLAVEAMYEGAYNFRVEVGGTEVADFTTHSLLGNLRLTLPIWRFQPYLLVGVGAQHGKWNDDFPVSLDRAQWDLVVRPAVGSDFYITENWVLFAEFGVPVRFADWVRVTEITDNIQMTLGGGLQYRF